MNKPVAYLMENDESKWLGYEPDPCADWVTPLYKEKWKMTKDKTLLDVHAEQVEHDCAEIDRAFAEAAPSLGIGDPQTEITMLKTINKDLSEKIAELVEILEQKVRTIEMQLEDKRKLEADAARYQWLRDKAIYVDPEQRILRICNVYIKVQMSPMTLDAAVDAAMGEWK